MTDIGFDQAYALLDRAATLMTPAGFGDMLTYVGHRLGVLAESYAREEPPINAIPLPAVYERTARDGKVYKSKFKSMKQQRKVFQLVKSGKIPYQRSGLLPNSITHWVELAGDRLLVHVGTNLKGAEYVIGAEARQSRYMAARGWFQLPRRIDDHAADFGREAQSAVTGYLQGYLAGKR